MPLFERYIGIDYSGAKAPTASNAGLRIYMATPAHPPEEVQPPPSPRKYWTRREVAEWLVEQLADEVPSLVGIDHAFSFPLAYFERYSLSRNWPAFLDDFQNHWPTDEDHVYVDSIRYGDRGNGTARTGSAKWRRITELGTPAKSVFHFDVPGQVAVSTHAGLPWIRFLRRQLGEKVHFWPFDGWRPPPRRSVIAEVYPRLWEDLRPGGDLTADQEDAYVVAAWMRLEDGANRLSGHLNPALSEEVRSAADIEGWILGLGGEDPKRDQRRKVKRNREKSPSEETHCAECHIRHDSGGVAWVDETKISVAEVGRLWIVVRQNLSALQGLLPSLSMGQIHSALAYYEDHRREVDGGRPGSRD